MFRRWLNRFKLHVSAPKGRCRSGAAGRIRFRPRLEELENRLVPATVLWVGGAAGSWGVAANWSTDALPGAGDNVVINGAVAVSHSAGADTVNTLSLGTGATLNIVGGSSIGATASSGPQVIDDGQIDLGDVSSAGSLLLEAASAGVSGTGDIVFGASAGNQLGQQVAGALTLGSGITVRGQNGSVGLAAATFDNRGTIQSDVAGGTVAIDPAGAFTNDGTVAALNGGTTLLDPGTLANLSSGTLTGGTWEAVGGGTLAGFATDIGTNAATILLGGNSSGFTTGSADALTALSNNASGGSFTLENGANFVSANPFSNAGTVVIGTGSTLTAPFTQTGGTTTLQGGNLANFGPAPGNSVSFNGTSDFVQVPSSSSLDSQALTSQGTLEAWVYLDQLPSAAGHIMEIMAKSEVGNDLDLQVETDDRIHFYVGDEFPDSVVSNTVLQAGQWYHIAATFQAGQPGQLQLFINGTLDATQTGNFARATNPNPLIIGANAVFPGRYFNGLITDVSVWNTVQTQAQIQANMNVLQGNETGVVGAWTFAEGTGGVAHDATANHNDGLLGDGVLSQEPAWTPSPVANVDLQGGILSGLGTVIGNLVNSGGTVAPGLGGAFTVDGSYAQGSGGTLQISLGGPSSSGEFGALDVTGLATVAGTLTVGAVNGYTPQFTDSYPVLNFASASGAFSTVNLPTLGGEPVLTTANTPTDLVLGGTQSSTFTTLASSPNPSTYGQAITLTATVTAASGSTPTGIVEFEDMTTGQNLGTANLQPTGGLDQSSIVLSSLAAGSHIFEAFYTSNQPSSFADSFSPGSTQVVNRALLTVTAHNATRVFGQANPVFTDTITGFVNGDTVAVVGGNASLSTAATTMSSVGTYTIMANQGTLHAANYTFAFVNGTLSVTADATSTTVAASSLGARVTLTATVAAAAPGSGTPTGSVDFKDTTTGADLGSVALSNGTASLIVTLSSASQTISATYGGSANFLGSAGHVTEKTSDSIDVVNATASAALSLVNGAAINLSGTLVVDSKSTTAASATGFAHVQAASISVVGGVQSSGFASFSPHPVTGALAVADPLGGLGAPTAAGPSLGWVVLGGNATRTLNPGVYAGISVSGHAHLTLNPGVYVINGGGFTVGDNGTVSGSGVLIVNNVGGAIKLSDQAVVNLTGPTTGAYSGIVFFQPAADSNSIAVTSDAVLDLHGGILDASAAPLSIANQARLIGVTLIVNELHLSDSGSIEDAAPSGLLPLSHLWVWRDTGFVDGVGANVAALLLADVGSDGQQPTRCDAG